VLNYKGDEYTTYSGSIVSVIFMICMLTYIIYLLKSMANRSTFYLNEHTLIRGVSLDQNGHFPAYHGFDFALTIKVHDYKHYPNLKERLDNKTIAIKAYQIDIIPPKEVGGEDSIQTRKAYLCIMKLDILIIDV